MEGTFMTDKQRKLFEKMIKGELRPWGNLGHFCENYENGLLKIIGTGSYEYEDCKIAWGIYENSPLMQALK